MGAFTTSSPPSISSESLMLAAILAFLAIAIPIYYHQPVHELATYTFITDYQGGTYICQKQAATLRAACFMWKEDIASGGYIPKLKTKAFTQLFDANIDEFPPVALDTLRNVWLFHVPLGNDQMDVHAVQTDMVMVEEETMVVADK